MCNLYSLTKGQAAICDWFRASNDRTGDLPLFPGIFPDQMAPIVRNGADGERELIMARWGMPSPPQFGGAPITNIRNVRSPHWRNWLGKHNRYIVPATSFCEYADTRPRKTPKWFALSQDRPLFAFAGLWTPWRGVRGPKSAPVDEQHELFGFLTTEANAVVAPPEQIIVRERFDCQRMIAESGRHRLVVQVTARNAVAGDPSSWSQFRAAPITAALASSTEVYRLARVRGFPWRRGTLDPSTLRRLGGEAPRRAATAF
jgi:putative SOS response-associated peptidase YedK